MVAITTCLRLQLNWMVFSRSILLNIQLIAQFAQIYGNHVALSEASLFDLKDARELTGFESAIELAVVSVKFPVGLAFLT